jgi:NADH-quinone oxidoreductase subunit I
MRATAPNGDADYEGRVAWSGELGYGVRSPELGQTASRTGAQAPIAATGDAGEPARDAPDEGHH